MENTSDSFMPGSLLFCMKSKKSVCYSVADNNGKALRVFYAILTKGVSYEGKFMLESIRYPENQVLGNRIAA